MKRSKSPPLDLPCQPTNAPPGSEEKVAVLAERYARGQKMDHDDDRTLDNVIGGNGVIDETYTNRPHGKPLFSKVFAVPVALAVFIGGCDLPTQQGDAAKPVTPNVSTIDASTFFNVMASEIENSEFITRTQQAIVIADRGMKARGISPPSGYDAVRAKYKANVALTPALRKEMADAFRGIK